MLRYVLDTEKNDRDRVSIDDKLDFVRDYLDLEALRLGERLQVAWDIAPDTAGHSLPPLTLQPLEENSIKHAFNPRSQPGRLEIRVAHDAGANTLAMSVRDDGPGADPAAVKASKGLGIRTVERRLRLGDGERARFSIATAPGAGFEVALSVPGEIEYLKADSKYTAIVRKGQTYLVRIGISELEARLDPARFVRIHRSALVNLDFVESMKADEQSLLQLEMRDGAVLTANREASRMLREMAI